MRADDQDRLAQRRTPAAGRAGRWIVPAVGLLLAGAVGAFLAFGGIGGGAPEIVPRAVAARLDAATRQALVRLGEQPCNRTLAGQVAMALLEASEYRSIIALEGQFRAACGADERLLSPLFRAQMRSSDFEGARRTGDRLTEAFAADPTAWGWRAEARERLGDQEGAWSDHRMALSLFPDPSRVAASVYFALAQAAARSNAPCEAMLTMRDYLAFDPPGRRTQQIATVMRGWQAAGGCRNPFGEGQAELRFDPGLGAIVVPAIVNGVATRLILDTGATRTVLAERLARRAGIQPAASDGATVTTGNGQIWLPGGRAGTIAVEGATARDVPVWIQSERDGLFEGGVEGLIGLSFLGNFRLVLTPGAVTLAPLN